MYNHNNRQFLLRQPNNSTWNIFYNPSGELQFSRLRGRSNTWSDPVTIVRPATPYFYALFGPKNEVIVIYQTPAGDIYLINLSRDDADPVAILKGRHHSDYNKHITALYSNGRLYIYFMIKHNNRSLLASLTYNEGAVSSPVTVDFVEYNDQPYSVVKDEGNNIYVFYPSTDGRFLQIGYKRYNTSQNTYSDFVTVSRGEGDNIYPRAIVDDNNIFHLIFQRTNDRQNQLLYTQKLASRNIWSDEVRIHSSSQSFLDSSLAVNNNILYVFRVLNDQIYYVFSIDNGRTFSKYSRYSFPCPKQLVCVVYLSTQPFRERAIVADELPCCFINGYKLAFVRNQDPAVSASNVSGSDFRTMVLDTQNTFRSSIEKIEEASEQNAGKINKLMGSLASMQRDLEKASLRMQAIESDMRSFSDMESTMNYLKRIVARSEDLSAGTDAGEQAAAVEISDDPEDTGTDDSIDID